MASFKTTFIVKMMTLWNYLNTVIFSCINGGIDFFEYIKDYFYEHHSTWLFIPNHSLPLALSNVYNKVEANWVYDKSKNTLGLNMLKSADEIVSNKFSWLSAKIRITDFIDNTKVSEYNIDDFLETFKIVSKENLLPTLYIIFMAWCIFNKHWFKTDDNVEFEIIDDMGENITLNIDENNYSFAIKRNKIYIIDSMTDENNEVADQVFYIENSEKKE